MEFMQIAPRAISCYYADDLTAEDHLAGVIRRRGDYWRFYPETGAVLTCKSLKKLAKKVSDLNGDAS